MSKVLNLFIKGFFYSHQIIYSTGIMTVAKLSCIFKDELFTKNNIFSKYGFKLTE